MGTTENIFVTDLEVFGNPTSGMYFIIVDAESNMPLWNGSEFSNQSASLKLWRWRIRMQLWYADSCGSDILILILLLVVVVLARRVPRRHLRYEYGYEEGRQSGSWPAKSRPPSAGPPATNVDPAANMLWLIHKWDKQPSKVTSTKVGISMARLGKQQSVIPAESWLGRYPLEGPRRRHDCAARCLTNCGFQMQWGHA